MILKVDQYGVIGDPISHSLSPLIHQMFAEQTKQFMHYERYHVLSVNFIAALEEFRAQSFRGFNITLPHKQAAYQWVQAQKGQLTQTAQQARAVNTMQFLVNGDVIGDNTDGPGLITDLEQHLHWPIAGASILVLGAGGAAQGIIGPLLALAPQQVIIANRTLAKAKELVAQFANVGTIESIAWQSLSQLDQAFDLIINATSSSLSNETLDLPANLVASTTRGYDLVYGRKTPFMQWLEQQGVLAISDGLGMLVEQAACSFQRWRGIRPQTNEVLARLRERPNMAHAQ